LTAGLMERLEELRELLQAKSTKRVAVLVRSYPEESHPTDPATEQ
jgi:hypothetical protein